MNIEGFRGRLCREKRAVSLAPALLGKALLSDDELCTALQLDFDETEPVIVSFYELYGFLEKLVGLILAEGMSSLVLVRIKMPSAIPLPPVLIDERVGIFHEVDLESQCLADAGKDHIVIDTDFKLYSWSSGKNTFSVRHVTSSPNTLDEAQFDLLQSVILTLPAQLERI